MCAVKAVGQLSRTGMKAYEAGDVPGAEFFLHQALLRAKGMKSPVLEAKILNNIGLILVLSGRKGDAVGYLQSALEKVQDTVGCDNKLHTVLSKNLEQARI